MPALPLTGRHRKALLARGTTHTRPADGGAAPPTGTSRCCCSTSTLQALQHALGHAVGDRLLVESETG